MCHSMLNYNQYVCVTCPSSGAGAQVSAQQANRNTGLLDGGRLLETQSCDGLRGHNRKSNSNRQVLLKQTEESIVLLGD